jgi:hypothetical protein
MSIEAMKQALEAMKKHGTFYLRHEYDYIKAITALRQAIEFEEMVKKGTKAWADTPDDWVDDLRGGAEAVAWMWKDGTLTSDPDFADGTWTPLFAAPPKRKWVGLDPEMMRNATLQFNQGALWAERYLKEKNT